MQNFFAALRLARKDFFELRRRHAAPEWALWVMTILVALAWGVGLTLVGLAGSARRPSLHETFEMALPILLSSLVIGVVFHIVYTAIERLASDRFLRWVNGEPGLLVNGFWALSSMACVALGLFLSYLVLGQLPGIGRVDWAPNSAWISVSIFGGFASVVWGLWAWQQWHEEQLKRQAQEAQLRLLQAQIEPHFLFNTLANVHGLMDHDLPKAKQMLGSFTDYLRVSLGSMRSAHSTVGQELELAQRYLQLLQGRMEDRLRFEISADETARAHPLPPLLLQPLVENAVMHGLEPSIEGGTVHVRAWLKDSTLVLEVQDDGLGLDAAPRPGVRRGNGLALHNIRERLLARFGPDARLDLQAAPPRGTLARITIPLDQKDAAA
jgi:two-component sensor histidine kinase